MSTEVLPITAADVEDSANLFVMSVASFVGFNKTALELAGACHTILNMVIQDLNKKHEQTTKGREGASGEGITAGSPEVPEIGTPGRPEESKEGVRPDDAGANQSGPTEERENTQTKL